MTRGWWLWLVILVTVLWMPAVAAADVPEWGSAPESEVTEEATEPVEATVEPEVPVEATQPRQPNVAMPVMVGAQAGLWLVGTLVYGMGAIVVAYTSLLFGYFLGPAPVVITVALVSLGYPIVSAMIVNSVGQVTGGGSYFPPTLVGSFLGTVACVALVLAAPSLLSSNGGIALVLAAGATGPILGYHLGRQAEWQREGWDVAVAAVMSSPTAWGTQSLEGAGLQLRFSF